MTRKRKVLFKWAYCSVLALALGLSETNAAPAEPEIPESVYQWVQSSERMNYFFNKEEMCYATDKAGQIDSDTLTVPVIKTYDNIQIEDVRMKRSWRRMEPIDTLPDLAGEANYLTFYLSRGVVVVEAIDLLDSQLSTLEHSEPGREVVIESLSPKSREWIFYQAILDYEQAHREEILARTKDKLTK